MYNVILTVIFVGIDLAALIYLIYACVAKKQLSIFTRAKKMPVKDYKRVNKAVIIADIFLLLICSCELVVFLLREQFADYYMTFNSIIAILILIWIVIMFFVDRKFKKISAAERE